MEQLSEMSIPSDPSAFEELLREMANEHTKSWQERMEEEAFGHFSHAWEHIHNRPDPDRSGDPIVGHTPFGKIRMSDMEDLNNFRRKYEGRFVDPADLDPERTEGQINQSEYERRRREHMKEMTNELGRGLL